MTGPGVSFHAPTGGGETSRLIGDKDWSATSLGPRASWPTSLGNYVAMILELPTPAIIFWGPDHVQLYNDGYSVIMGPRHPRHLGSTFLECWPDAYPAISPWMERVLQGETVEVDQLLVPLTRYGFTEEAYFTFTFTPLRDDRGAIAGILNIVSEVTGTVLGTRRSAALHELSNRIPFAKTADDAARLALEVLAGHADDLPCCAIYHLEDGRLTRAGALGMPADCALFPAELRASAIPELAQVVRDGKPVEIDQLAHRAGAWPDAPARALASPIRSPDQRQVAILVAGISPRLALDAAYRSFIQLVCAQLGSMLAAARAADDERKRAEAQAALDRAKTEFFSNISHEFRTPLTLILGPLEEALDGRAGLTGDALDAVHRNALRMLRLVNTVLDFARLEANRVTQALEPTDLAALTAGLAGSFRSLIESAGLALDVECPPLARAVLVDRLQWEKIVLNLVSNAFKFTFEGAIAVRLRDTGETVELAVEDTGTGIPVDELPRLFERFHRVQGARGRTFEGTGIGLALVHELVQLHGGSVRVESEVDRGTTFTVAIPKRIGDGVATVAELGASALPYVLEASRWTREPMPAEPAPAPSGAHPRARILIADDSADMRDHLVRLLSPSWAVETVEDGQAALEAALRRPPDLVLTDVMMPRMDGTALVTALRADPRTSTLPIVMLSARAGEDAVIGGLDTGADDYLVKPFSARELVARVRAHLHMAHLRREWTRDLERANTELEAFSYSVSHDLRAPLRAIDGFSHALSETHAAALGPDGLHYLSRIGAGIRRMSQLIDDLLDLAQITRAALTRKPVDLSALARRILGDLREHHPARAVEAEVAEGLAVTADPRLIAVALENLIGNAWKFSARTPVARVEIGCDSSGGEPVYFVRDNGAGFDMRDVTKLFTPFQRLHAQADFEGTGVGLATVQRVISRHGGRLWADAAPGRGATFYFTVPVRA